MIVVVSSEAVAAAFLLNFDELWETRSVARSGHGPPDEITVGGFGLASVTIERTVLRPGAEQALAPGQQGPPPTPGTTPSSSGPTAATAPTGCSGGDARSSS